MLWVRSFRQILTEQKALLGTIQDHHRLRGPRSRHSDDGKADDGDPDKNISEEPTLIGNDIECDSATDDDDAASAATSRLANAE